MPRCRHCHNYFSFVGHPPPTYCPTCITEASRAIIESSSTTNTLSNIVETLPKYSAEELSKAFTAVSHAAAETTNSFEETVRGLGRSLKVKLHRQCECGTELYTNNVVFSTKIIGAWCSDKCKNKAEKEEEPKNLWDHVKDA